MTLKSTAHLLLSLIALTGSACSPSSNVATTADTTKTADGWPTDPEVLDYLDGKTISLTLIPEKSESTEAPAELVLKKGEITSLEVKKSGTAITGEPWTTSIYFLVDSDKQRYAVDAAVRHRKVGEKRAFYGLKVERIAKQ